MRSQVRLATRKVKGFMKGKTVYFNGAGDPKLSDVEQACNRMQWRL